MLQVAYNLGHSEGFIQSWSYKKADGQLNPIPTPPTGRVASGFVSWGSNAIFKDNDTKRDYEFGELVSAMSGPDVGIIQSPFSILPHEDVSYFSGCITSASGKVKTQDVTIDNVPYAYAIPLLTGWDLSYPCKDHHVRELGVWLNAFGYDKDPVASTGTLHCQVSSVLHDDSQNWGDYSNKISILGLRPTAKPMVRGTSDGRGNLSQQLK